MPKYLGFPGKPASKGGPGSFQQRFASRMKEKGWQIVYPGEKITPDIILVNNSTKHIWWLLKSKFKGSAIIYRVGGINWLYRHDPDYSGIEKAFATLKDNLIGISHRLLGDAIIFQSEFSEKWLIKLRQSGNLKNRAIIYNGVDLDVFKPQSDVPVEMPDISLLCVEGNLDYSPYAISLLNFLQEKLVNDRIINSIKIYGDFECTQNRYLLNPSIQYMGMIKKDQIHTVYERSVYLSLDIHAACPNAVIEALACGIPVVGFDTGALKEIVTGNAGLVVPFGGDPWKLDQPDFDALAQAIIKVVRNYSFYAANARNTAQEKFSLDTMVEKYLSKINELISD